MLFFFFFFFFFKYVTSSIKFNSFRVSHTLNIKFASLKFRIPVAKSDSQVEGPSRSMFSKMTPLFHLICPFAVSCHLLVAVWSFSVSGISGVCVFIWNAIKLKSYYQVLSSNVVFFLFFILQVQLFQRFSSELKPPFSLLRWIAVALRTLYEHWQPYEDSGFLLVAIKMSHFDIIIK